MRKRIVGRHLGRNRGSRRALFRSLIRALVSNEKITTTKAKAKAVQPEIDRIMTRVRQNSISARRLVLARLGNDKETTKKLFQQYLPLAKGRNSGFTRIVKLPRRKGDLAELARLEWVEKPKSDKRKVHSDKKKTKKIKTKKA